MNEKWLDWARRIQAVSQAGLAFSQDVFDIERYQELGEISAEIFGTYTNLSVEHAMIKMACEEGYPTPKADVRGAVFNNGKILLVKEKRDDKWSLPGGFAEVGLSPSENIVKEIKEESGFEVLPIKLLAILDMNRHPHPPQMYHYYKIFIQCELAGGSPRTGLETSDVEFFSEQQLPPLSVSRNTESQIKMMFDFLTNPLKDTIFD